MTNTLERPQSRVRAPRRTARRRRRLGLIRLVGLVAAFLALSLPPYLTLDPSRSLVPIDQRIALHYPMLLGHILFGTITLGTVCLQLWSWLRRTHPRVHRISGRVYVFAGMLPTCVLAIAVVPMGELGLAGATGATSWGVVGLVTTLRGFLAARARRIADHRRWMILSFAAAMGIATGRVLSALVPLAPGLPQQVAHEVAGFWLGWAVSVAIAYWWLHRRPARDTKRHVPRAAAPSQ